MKDDLSLPAKKRPDTDPDAFFHTAAGRLTGGLSPVGMTLAYLDWAMHLAGSPSKQAELWRLATENLSESWPGCECKTDDKKRDPQFDPRFCDPAWRSFPFDWLSQNFVRAQNWWEAATTDIHGVDPDHAQIMRFMVRQAMDMASPSNYFPTNPVVQARTLEESGGNLVRGAKNWIEDFNHLVSGTRPTRPEFRVGETLAVTPGEVIYRNRLIELIRYTPTTKTVRREPILIVPAWIMKYYVLDLSPKNSLVRYLVGQGFEVFVISWRNPGAEDADLRMDDYVELGVKAAMSEITKGDDHQQVHAVGYCLGGTLLAITAAALARDGAKRFASLSLLAAQVDFTEAGELSLFINESQIAFLEDIMKTQGYLRADQMAGAFRILRSNDLIWSRVIRHYLLGERTKMNDLMAWNADTTRMPARMHSEYLRWLFLENRLARGRYRVDGRPVALTDIRAPVFCLGTEKDHVSPWRSVFKLRLLTDTDVTFCLTSGGHNGGVVSEPGHAGRHYRINTKSEGARHVSAEEWFENTPVRDGSWWPEWSAWLSDHSGPRIRARKKPGKSLGSAPGRYVLG